MNARPVTRLMSSAALALALGGATAVPVGPVSTAWAQAAPVAPPGAPASFADIVQRVAPAVVSIDVTRSAPAVNDLSQLFPGFPFPLLPNRPNGEPGRLPQAQVSGSGFFISADGYVVTNNHVVENATKVMVGLNDGRELPARVVGRDPLTDLAVLKVEGRGFPYVSFETQAKPRVGDWVLAMGNPFGLGGTATAGIVSAYGRDIGETYVDFLQIDAPINRGNSGGPTFDVYGRVIGVNTAIFSPSGGSVGIGFAIPADLADGIVRQLIAGGSIVRGYIGATIQNLTPEIADSLGLKGRKGALVAEVTPGGPSERAGLKSGDVVLALNGRPLASSSDLTRRVAQAREGDLIRLDVWRDGRTRTVDVRAARRPADLDQGPGPAAPDAALGLTVAPLDPLLRERYGLKAGQTGVVVTAVAPGSEAAEKGVRAGDVIDRVGERPIRTTEDLRQAVDEARRDHRPAILARITRQGRSIFVPLKVASS